MDAIEKLQTAILDRQIDRREMLRHSLALGLSAPIVTGLLAACDGNSNGPGDSDGTEDSTSSDSETSGTDDEKSGESGDRRLRLRWWQAPTILNPHFAQGSKDLDASRLILEPLADVLDDGSLVPRLAAAIPSREAGEIGDDGAFVVWRLKEGVTWHDGEALTSSDVRFTLEWLLSEENSPTTVGAYKNIDSIDVPDDLTVIINFSAPNPAWFECFVGSHGCILPMHILQDFTGADAAGAEFNLKPIGTGPYQLDEFTPGESVTYERNENYHVAGTPFFESIELVGGGDPASAARAVVQTDEADYAWNLQVESQVLDEIEGQAVDGELLSSDGLGVERIVLNFANPREEVDQAVSDPSTDHPFLTDSLVREAFALLCDRERIATDLYGQTGEPSANWLSGPEHLVSPNTRYEFDIGRARELLDEAGWTEEDGVRQKDGTAMEVLFQTSTNSLRQRTQELIGDAFEEAGIPVEIKVVEAGAYFSSDPENPDTAARFAADMGLYTSGPTNPYPIVYCGEGASSEIAERDNNWSGRNYSRWSSEEFDEAYERAKIELDPDIQSALFITMNDLIVGEHAHIPLVRRNNTSAKKANLYVGDRSRWTSDLYNIHNWRWIE